MVNRTNCTHFEYKEIEEKGKRVKIPSCKIGKMKGIGGCGGYCEWFELLGPKIPGPPMPLEPDGPLKPP